MVNPRTERTIHKILFLLIITDLVFIGLHIVNCQTSFVSHPLLLLETDRGYAEMYQYSKMSWIVLLMGSAAVLARASSYLVWALIFGYLLLDDAATIHETIGGRIIGDELSRLSLSAGRASYHLGQILFAVLVGLLLLGYAIVLYRFSTGLEKRTTRYLLKLLSLFAFFSIVVDAIGSFSQIPGLSIIEEGGELIVISVAVWFVSYVHSDICEYGASAPHDKSSLGLRRE